MRHSPVLWYIYLEFELKVGRPSRAKTLLFQAVASCPWVKGFYLLAFDQLRSSFTPAQLDAWSTLMAERQIRLRTDIEDLLVDWIPEGNSDSEHISEEGDLEIEHRAQEYRRLRPY